MTLTQETLLTLIGVLFGAGTAYGLMQGKIEKVRGDANNIGKIMRDNERRAERRWLLGIASLIDTSTTLEEAKVHAKLLKEESWKI